MKTNSTKKRLPGKLISLSIIAIAIMLAMYVWHQRSPTAHREAETAKAHRG